MEKKTDKAVALLQLLKGLGGAADGSGQVYLVEALTSEPDDVTLSMQGMNAALGADVFEIPVEAYPLREGDRFLALPVAGGERWALIQKLTGGVVMATMKSASSLQPDGMTVTYGADRLVIPAYVLVGNATSNGYLTAANSRALQNGDRVSIAPLLVGDTIKYAVLARY